MAFQLVALLMLCSLNARTAASQPVSPTGVNSTKVAAAASGWRVLWRDEFDSGLNRNVWKFELGAGCQYLSEDVEMCGWGNGEQQFYTSRPSNARVANGALVIEARKEPSGRLTSARLRTLGSFSIMPDNQFKVIRVEARISLPQGTGLWPAFWMLPSFSEYQLGTGLFGRWAQSGEIDIMESCHDMAQVHGTMHFGGQWPKNSYLTKVVGTPNNKPFAKNWHTYAIEWERDMIRWYVDGIEYSRQVSGQDRGGWFSLGPNAGPTAPFDKPFHIILNMALGGGFTGNTPREVVAATLESPKRMFVDWVRVSGRNK